MIRLSANKCLHYAEILDEYEFYEEADFYTKIANVKLAEVPYDPKRLPSWIRETSKPEELMMSGMMAPVKALERSKLKRKQKDLILDASFGSLDLGDVATSTPEAYKSLKSIKSFSNLLAKNPAAAQKAEGFLAQLATKFPKIGKFVKMTPLIGVIINLYLSRKDIAKYIDLISQGKFELIWNDAEERAKFIELVLMTIAGVLTSPMVATPFPGLGAVGAALYAFSSASSLGRQGIDAYLRYSGEKDENKDKLSKMSDNADEIYQEADPEVQEAANKAMKMLKINPNLKNIQIINSPEFSKYKWLTNRTTSENQLKAYMFSKLITSLKASQSKSRTKLQKPSTQTPINTNLQTIQKTSPEKSQKEKSIYYVQKMDQAKANKNTVNIEKLKQYIIKDDPTLEPQTRKYLLDYLNKNI